MQLSQKAIQLIDELINHWREYIRYDEYSLLMIASDAVNKPENNSPFVNDKISNLKIVLNEKEFITLPTLIMERRSIAIREAELKKYQRENEKAKRYEMLHMKALIREAERREAERIEQEAKHKEKLRQDEFHHQAMTLREVLNRKKEELRIEKLQMIRRNLETNYLGVDQYYQDKCAEYVSRSDYELEKIQFVKRWIAKNRRCLAQC